MFSKFIPRYRFVNYLEAQHFIGMGISILTQFLDAFNKAIALFCPLLQKVSDAILEEIPIILIIRVRVPFV